MTKIHSNIPAFYSMPPEQIDSNFASVEANNTTVQLTTSGNIEGHFLSKEEALPIILAEDDFMQSLSDFDCQLRKAKNKETYRQHYANQILEWTPEEIVKLDDILERVKQKLTKYKITLPKTVNFIKTTGKEELPNTWAYCRRHTIVICNLSGISEDLLTHELFHIHSQVDPKNRGRLYELIGFHSCNSIVLPKSLANVRVVNPDSPHLNSYIEVIYKGEKVKAIPLDIYDAKRTRAQPSGGSTFLPNIYHKFVVVEEDESGLMKCSKDSEGNPITFDLKEASGFKDQIGENTGYIDSPEEIMADNFKILVQNSHASTPSLVERMKKIFTESFPDISVSQNYEMKVPDAINHQLQRMKVEQVLSENQTSNSSEKMKTEGQSKVENQEFADIKQFQETNEKQSDLSIEKDVDLKEVSSKSTLDVLNMPPKRKVEVQENKGTIHSKETFIKSEGIVSTVKIEEPEEVQKPQSKVEEAPNQEKKPTTLQKVLKFLMAPLVWIRDLFKRLFKLN